MLFKIKTLLDKQEFDVLMKSLDFYIVGGVTFDYPDEVEICKDVQRKIKRHLSIKNLDDNKIN